MCGPDGGRLNQGGPSDCAMYSLATPRRVALSSRRQTYLARATPTRQAFNNRHADSQHPQPLHNLRYDAVPRSAGQKKLHKAGW